MQPPGLGLVAPGREHGVLGIFREQASVGHYRQALALAEELGMHPLQAHCHHGLGMLYARQGQQEQARAALSIASELYRIMTMTRGYPRQK
jgi:hypothetical protein